MIRDAISECKVGNTVFECRNGAEALDFLYRRGPHAKAPRPGLVYLDIEMPGMNGFQFLQALGKEPLVVFTTAYSQYALQAFEVNSIDYLLKPIEPQHLERALNKLDRLHAGTDPRPDLNDILRRLSSSYPERLSSRRSS